MTAKVACYVQRQGDDIDCTIGKTQTGKENYSWALKGERISIREEEKRQM